MPCSSILHDMLCEIVKLIGTDELVIKNYYKLTVPHVYHGATYYIICYYKHCNLYRLELEPILGNI